MLNRHRFIHFAVIATLGGGYLLQVVGCVGSAARYLASFNPCGTILACDPVEYRFQTSGYQGPGVDPVIDPACTYPPFCDGDPFVGTVEP